MDCVEVVEFVLHKLPESSLQEPGWSGEISESNQPK
jgi:hypothetical protein